MLSLRAMRHRNNLHAFNLLSTKVQYTLLFEPPRIREALPEKYKSAKAPVLVEFCTCHSCPAVNPLFLTKVAQTVFRVGQSVGETFGGQSGGASVDAFRPLGPFLPSRVLARHVPPYSALHFYLVDVIFPGQSRR